MASWLQSGEKRELDVIPRFQGNKLSREEATALASVTLPVAQTLLLATCFSLSREHRGSQTSARNPGAGFHLHHDPRYSSLLPSETLSGPSTALLPFLPSPGWSPSLGPWQQSTLPKGQMSEGVEKRCPFLLVYSQTLTPCPRLFPLLLPPIDFLVSMEPNSICVHSLPGLASFRDPRAPLVPTLLTGQGCHIHHFLTLSPTTLSLFPALSLCSKGTI